MVNDERPAPGREIRVQFRFPEQVQVASATVDKLCEGLDLDPESRSLVRRRTEDALREWLDALADPCRNAGTAEPVELVIDVTGDHLRLELHGGVMADALRVLVPIRHRESS